MNFYDTHSNFYLSCAVLIGLFILYNLKNCKKNKTSQFLYVLALLIYILRGCNIIAFWADPYQDYHLYIVVLVYTTQSIMIIATVAFITSRLSRSQDASGILHMKKDFNEFKKHLALNKRNIALLLIWNLILYLLAIGSQVLYNPYLARVEYIFLVSSYWVTAHHLNNLSYYPEIAEEIKRKLDIIVTCLTMLGFVNLVSTLFEPLVMKYILALQGSIYVFEVITTAYISNLFSSDAKGDFIQFNQVEKV